MNNFMQEFDESARQHAARVRTTIELEAPILSGDNRTHLDWRERLDDLLLSEFHDINKRFPVDNKDLKRIYWKHIFPVLSPSVFFKRAYEKPHGYAGDYLLMEMMYQRRPLPTSGSNKFSDILDQWFLNSPSSCASRSRQDYMVSILERAVNKRVSKIGNLASGPCREIRTVVDRLSSNHTIPEFVCVDSDPQANQYAEGLLNELDNPNLTCTFVRENLAKFALGRHIPQLKNCDLIYCIGFADYVSDRLLLRFINTVYEHLLPGGTFHLGQFVDLKKHPDRRSMEWAMDWNLIYRTPDLMRKLFSQTSFGKKVEIKMEPTGLIMIVEATKS